MALEDLCGELQEKVVERFTNFVDIKESRPSEKICNL